MVGILLRGKPSHKAMYTRFTKLFLFLLLMIISSFQVHADTGLANGWLLGQVSMDNHIALDTDIASQSQSTAEAYMTLRGLGLTNPADLSSIKQSILAATPSSTETNTRKLLALALDGDDTSSLVEQLLASYRLAQQFTPTQAGIGEFDYYDQNALETVWALQALASVNYTGSEIASLVTYLTTNQLADGSFAELETQQAKVYWVTQAIIALQAYRTRYNVEQPLNKATVFLQSLATTSGHWGETFANALALLALLPTATDLTDYHVAIQALENAQLANGSWGNDVYVTALAARVLYLVENFTEPTPITTGNVTGNVVNSTTAQALAGVTITLSQAGQADIILTTDNNGQFLFNAIAQGDYTARFELTGFAPITQSVTVISQSTLNIGQVALTPAIAGVTGRVVNSVTGQALAGVMITLSQAGQADVVFTSDNSGNFLFNELEPADYSARFELVNFVSVERQFTVTTPVLESLGNVSLTPSTASVTGRVTDADTGEPIVSASITLTGTSNVTTITDSNGQYSTTVTPGTITIEVSAANYQTVSGTGSVEGGGILSFSPQLLEQGNPPPPDNVKSDLFGVVIDQTTGDPITGAQVSVVGQAITAQTDATGAFILLQLDDGAIQFTVSQTGYTTNQYDLIVPKATNVNVGTLALVPQTDPILSSISGNLVDVDTNQPVADVHLTLSSGEQVTSAADGGFIFENIAEGDYQLTITKAGYLPLQYSIDVPASTQVQTGKLLLKQSQVDSASILQGQVTDQATGLPVAGATVKVEESGQTVTTDSDGQFEITDIILLNYSVFTQATGYWSRLSQVSLQEPGTTQLPIVLEQVSQNGITIEDAQTDQASYPAYAPVAFSAEIHNESAVTQRINALFHIENSAGEVIHRVLFGDVAGSQTGNEIVAIAPNNTALVNGQWFTGIQTPGEYTLVTRVFDDLSDRLLVEQTSQFSIIETKQLLELVLDATPLFANVGEQTQITLNLNAVNRSNVPYELVAEYQWVDPQGQAIKSASQTILFNPEDLDKRLELDSFAFVFAQSGAYPTTLTITSGPTPIELNTDTINIAPSVRIESTQTISPTQVTPDGDKRIKLGIQIKGVEQ